MINKSIKVFFQGKRMRDIYPYATKWQVFKFRVRRFIRRLIIAGGVVTTIIWMLYGAYSAGSRFNPSVVYAEKQVMVESVTAPVLDRIAKCESNSSQFDKNGQVIFKANDNHTVDVGYYQINMSTWGKKANSMGFDLTKEGDNKMFGMWLYKNYGTVPWIFSQSCWNK